MGEHIDLILQTGDLGAYPAEQWLDGATLRHARRDPEELGFMHSFRRYDPSTLATLQRLQANLLFVRGNHEAHDWLDQLEQQARKPIFPVDVYQRVYCLKSGEPYTFRHNNEQITILGIGRIGAHGDGRIGHKPAHLQPYELERLSRLSDAPNGGGSTGEQIDVLVTHDAPYGLIFPDSGLSAVQSVLQDLRPLYHFFGHYLGHMFLEMCYLNRATYACKLAEPHFNKKAPDYTLTAGVMGILRWTDRRQRHFELVDAPWLGEYTARSWRAL